MKKYILLLLLAFISFGAKAQFTITYSAGYGDYDMADMKDLMKMYNNNMAGTYPGLNIRLLDNFPATLTHNLDIAYKVKKFELGLKATYMTTGSKSAYADYSGEYMEKIVVNGYRIGALCRMYFPVADLGSSAKVSFFGELSPAIVFSNLDYEGYLKFGSQTINFPRNIDGSAIGFSLQPMLGAKLDITRNIGLLLSGGYDFELGSSIPQNEYIFGTQREIHRRTDWTGFRANAGVSYTFGM